MPTTTAIVKIPDLISLPSTTGVAVGRHLRRDFLHRLDRASPSNLLAALSSRHRRKTVKRGTRAATTTC
jgi:hypothetical protein